MSKFISIRLANEKDSASLLSIYGEYIKNTAITFEIEVPSESEFGIRIKNVIDNLPWLVCEIDGEIVGYAYAAKHRERVAYQWSVDTTVYLKHHFHRRHIATALYTTLLQLLKLQGYYNAFAGVALPNTESTTFHEAFGFKSVGVFHNAGYKLNEWRDVKWFELTINEHVKSPTQPKSINEIKDTKEFKDIIEGSLKLIK